MRCSANKDSDEIVEPVLKYIVVSFNLIAFLISIGYIIAGSWLCYIRDSQLSQSANFSSIFDLTTDLGAFLIVLGILGIIFTSIGIAATYRENILALRLFLFVLILKIIINVVMGVVFLIFSGKILTAITSDLQSNYINNYFDDDTVQTVMDTLQSQYSCCGIGNYTSAVNGYLDWGANPYFNCTNTNSAVSCMVPASCCVNYLNSTTPNLFCSGSVLSGSGNLATINTAGCTQAISNLAQYGLVIFSSVVIAITVILAINAALIQYLIILIQKEQALYNSKYKLADSSEQLDEDFFN